MENLKNGGSKYELSNAFCDVINNLYPDPENSELTVEYYTPIYFLKTLFKLNGKFKQGEQNDAKEFILYVITKLNEELNDYPYEKDNDSKIKKPLIKDDNKKEKNSEYYNYEDCYKYSHSSIISDTFCWDKQILVNCKNCSHVTQSFQSCFYMKFELETIRREKYFRENESKIQKIIPNTELTENDIEEINNKISIEYEKKQNTPVSLKECIDYYLSEKSIENKENKCKFCCGNNLFLKNNIYASPNVFIFILERGKNNIYNVKLEFSESLNLTEYVVSDSCEHKYNNYKLIGVVTHTGMSGGKDGHFIAFIKSQIGSKWYKCNDDNVTEAERTEVFNTGYPYVLLYKANKKD